MGIRVDLSNSDEIDIILNKTLCFDYLLVFMR